MSNNESSLVLQALAGLTVWRSSNEFEVCPEDNTTDIHSCSPCGQLLRPIVQYFSQWTASVSKKNISSGVLWIAWDGVNMASETASHRPQHFHIKVSITNDFANWWPFDLVCQQRTQKMWSDTVKPLILATLNFGVWVNLIILDPVILAFLLPTTMKRYCIKIFANLPGSRNSRNKGHAKKNGFYNNSGILENYTSAHLVEATDSVSRFYRFQNAEAFQK